MLETSLEFIGTQVMSLGVGGLLMGGIWAFRVIMAYCRETREEYVTRLNEAVLELERQKNINVRLELKIHTMEFLHSMKETGIIPKGKANS